MMRNQLLLFLIITVLKGQTVLLFDGAGQTGIHSKEGLVFWNTSIFSGPILMDGTFNYFPQKYGIFFSETLQNNYDAAVSVHIKEDTIRFSTIMDYQMGDYNLDQLDLKGRYNSGSGYVRFSGFKRSFSGNSFPAQFIRTDGRSIPLQQVYHGEYGSKTSERSVKAAVIIMNSDYNLITADFNNYGKIEDRITAGGIAVSRKLGGSVLNFGTSQYHQIYDPVMPFFSERKKVRLNRQFSTIGIDSLTAGRINLFSNLEVQSQGTRQAGHISNTRNWVTVSGGLKTGIVLASFGGTASDGTFMPELRARLKGHSKRLSISAGFKMFNKPSHSMVSMENDWENWRTSTLSLRYSRGSFLLGGSVNYSNAGDLKILDHDSSNWTPINIDESSMSTTIYGALSLFGKMDISVFWDHLDNTSLLSDGIGDRIRTEISFSQDIRILAITLKGNLHWEEYFNRNYYIGFDPHWGIPYQNGPIPQYNTSLNNMSGKLSVEISSMTIYGAIYNIPNYLGNNFSFVDVNSTWVQNNAYLPPMGKMTVIGINWKFLN